MKTILAICLCLFSSVLFAQQRDSSVLDDRNQTEVPTLPLATNPNQIAILRWYRANQAASFAVPNSPRQVVFDRSSIWVSRAYSVTKLQASDGTSLGNFPAGSSPSGMAFDGENIWVADQGSSSVTKLRASDGKTLGKFPVDCSPFAVAFDAAREAATKARKRA